MFKADVRDEILDQARPIAVSVYIPQIRIGKKSVSQKKEGLIYHREPIKIWETKLKPELDRVSGHNKLCSIRDDLKRIDVVVFPELSVPRNSVDEIARWSESERVIVIAGSHYVSNSGKWNSVCPVIIDGKIYETYKLVPSPFESAGLSGDGLQSGPFVTRFKNSRIGNFSVFICSDYLDRDAHYHILDEKTDIAFVIACQPDASAHYSVASMDCAQSKDGIYIVYSNLYFPDYGDGKSAAFGQVHRDIVGSFKRLGYSDLQPKEKLWQSSSKYPAAIIEFDLHQRKPTLAKVPKSRTNVNVLMPADFEVEDSRSVRNASHQRAFKVVAFDLDGTLLRSGKYTYSWQSIWVELWGDTHGERWISLMREYLQKRISYERWCEIAVSEFRAKGITALQIVKLAKEHFELVENCDKVLRRLKAEGYKLVLLSGGIDAFLTSHIADAAELFDVIHINQLDYDDKFIVRSVKATSYDFDGKRQAIQELCEEEGIPLEDIVYVGDSINDESLLTDIGCFISVSKDAMSTNALYSNVHITAPDLSEVYKVISKGKSPATF